MTRRKGHAPDRVEQAAREARAGRRTVIDELGGALGRGDALTAPAAMAPEAAREAGKTVCSRALACGWDRAEVRRLLDMLGIGGAQ